MLVPLEDNPMRKRCFVLARGEKESSEGFSFVRKEEEEEKTSQRWIQSDIHLSALAVFSSRLVFATVPPLRRRRRRPRRLFFFLSSRSSVSTRAR